MITFPDQWTREMEFGITVNCRRVRNCKVTALRHETGSYVHRVEYAILEWVTPCASPPAPKPPVFKLRFVLACYARGLQDRAQLFTGRQRITCRKCKERK